MFSESDILTLREKVKPYLTEKRYSHTLAVEKEAAYLGSIYLPEKIAELRVSALLHDVTKKCDFEKQLQYCSEFGIINSNYDMLSPKVFHAKTAAELIKRDFPGYATDEVVRGVRWHTTGREGMDLFESIVYLADYIEETRTFPECVALRDYFRRGIENGEDKTELFFRTMIRSFDNTIGELIGENAPIDPDTVGARNYFIRRTAG